MVAWTIPAPEKYGVENLVLHTFFLSRRVANTIPLDPLQESSGMGTGPQEAVQILAPKRILSHKITTSGSADTHDFPRKVCDTGLVAGVGVLVFDKRLKTPAPNTEKEKGGYFFSFSSPIQ